MIIVILLFIIYLQFNQRSIISTTNNLNIQKSIQKYKDNSDEEILEERQENINFSNLINQSLKRTKTALTLDGSFDTISKKVDYTFDGVYFENIEKIGTFPPIINLKNSIKQRNEEEKEICFMFLENHHPQLCEFMVENTENFSNFFKLNNNVLLTLKQF